MTDEDEDDDDDDAKDTVALRPRDISGAPRASEKPRLSRVFRSLA